MFRALAKWSKAQACVILPSEWAIQFVHFDEHSIVIRVSIARIMTLRILPEVTSTANSLKRWVLRKRQECRESRY